MTTITLKGNPIETVGELPAIGTKAPPFTITGTDLRETGPADYPGKTIVLNIFPSIDTPVCATSTRRFNQVAGDFNDTVVFCISADLPFAHNRFCEVEGLKNVIPLSIFRSPDFGKDYGVTIATGPLRGVLSRAIVIIDQSGSIAYTEQVPEIGQEPDYDAAITLLSGLNRS